MLNMCVCVCASQPASSLFHRSLQFNHHILVKPDTVFEYHRNTQMLISLMNFRTNGENLIFTFCVWEVFRFSRPEYLISKQFTIEHMLTPYINSYYYYGVNIFWLYARIGIVFTSPSRRITFSQSILDCLCVCARAFLFSSSVSFRFVVVCSVTWKHLQR